MEGAREALERLLEVVQIMVTEASKALHRESVNGEAVRTKRWDYYTKYIGGKSQPWLI